MRHGEVCYTDDAGNPVADSVNVLLTAKGVQQAERIAQDLSGITFERVICTGFPRTLQTAQIVSGLPREKIDVEPDLREIKEGDVTAVPVEDRLGDIVYYMEDAAQPNKSFAGGDTFEEFSLRVLNRFDEISRSPNWTNLLLVAHGVVNRLILSYLVTGSKEGGLISLARFEQDSCCLNVVDLDYENGEINRSYLRLVNMTPYDPVKKATTLISAEASYYQWLGPFNN